MSAGKNAGRKGVNRERSVRNKKGVQYGKEETVYDSF